MTSISNYESVELPIEPLKEKQGFFDFIKNLKGKKQNEISLRNQKRNL